MWGVESHLTMSSVTWRWREMEGNPVWKQHMVQSKHMYPYTPHLGFQQRLKNHPPPQQLPTAKVDFCQVPRHHTMQIIHRKVSRLFQIFEMVWTTEFGLRGWDLIRKKIGLWWPKKYDPAIQKEALKKRITCVSMNKRRHMYYHVHGLYTHT